MGNSKITDKKNIDSGIQAENVYVGIMPLRSFSAKMDSKNKSKEAFINIDRDFLKGINFI